MTDKNEGEGSRTAGRAYDKAAEKFVKDGKVAPAAEAARDAVDADPAAAAAAEAAAKRGPKKGYPLLDDIRAREESVVNKIKHVITRAVDRIRARH